MTRIETVSYNTNYIPNYTARESNLLSSSSNELSRNPYYVNYRLPDYIPGIRDKQSWTNMMSDIMYYEFMDDPIFNDIKNKLRALSERNEPLDYDALIALVDNASLYIPNYIIREGGSYVAEDLRNLKKALVEEKAIYTSLTTAVNEKIDSIDSYLYPLKEAISKPITPEDLDKFKKLIKELEDTKQNISQMYQNQNAFNKYYQDESKTNKLLEDAQKALNEQTPVVEQPERAPIPESNIPLEEGETIRNQTTKRGLGSHSIAIASGAAAYLKAFYKFNMRCNELISMNTQWGVQLSKLQKEAADLNISCQNAIAKMIQDVVNDFSTERNDSSKISGYQSTAAAVQADFAAFQKTLDSITPLILEQPKNITKDLDKFLEAAKSILQLVTTYANFRL